MRHCVIMTAYQDVDMLNRFVSRIPSDWGVYVHIDKHSAIDLGLISDRAKLFVIEKIYWGAWEHLKVICRLLDEALKDDVAFDYFHIVTAQDYFASSPDQFDIILGEDGVNYLGCFPLPNPHWGWDGGLKIYQYKTLSSWMDIRKPFAHILDWLLRTAQRILRLKRPLPSFPLFGGSVYSSLHRDFVKWVVTDELPIKFLADLRNTTCPEEIYFQTMIMNSPFCDKRSDDEYLRFIDWHSVPAPRLLDENDAESILTSKKLFCRKVSTERSGLLLDMLDDKLCLREY